MTDPQRSPPQFTAMMLLERHVEVRFADLARDLARIAPGAQLGDWNGPIPAPSADLGAEALSLDGVQMAALAVDARAPASALDFGPFPNLLWPDPAATIGRHRAHVLIVSPDQPEGRAAAVAKARAVTLVAAAYAGIAPVLGIVWVDSANLVSPEIFKSLAGALATQKGMATAFWVRIVLAQDQSLGTGARFIAGTLGLAALGHLELEYKPTTDAPASIASHALATSEYLLSSGAELKEGQTIDGIGQRQFRLKSKPRGTFSVGTVFTLEVA